MSKKPVRKWEYRVRSTIYLPPAETRRHPDSPMMDSEDMEMALNLLDEEGWELVTYGQKKWHDQSTQQWWIFRRPFGAKP